MTPEDAKDDRALAPNDPYNNMERQDTRPSFRPEDLPENQNNPTSKAKNHLASAEQSAATNPISTINGGADAAKSTEQNQTFNPRFTGKGLSGKEKEETGKGKGFLKRQGPLLAIISLLMGGGGMMVGSQTLMPFATANRIIEEFNSMKTVMSKRSDRLMRYQMNGDRYKNPTRTTIFGNEKFKLSSKQRTRLESEGIFYMETADGKTRFLAYDDGSGVRRPILTETDIGKIDADADAFNAKLKADFPEMEFSPSRLSIGEALEIDGFRNGYLKSSKTWRGSFAGWFDSLVLKIFDRVGIDRNRFKKWKTAGDVEAGNTAFKQAADNQKNLTDSTEAEKTVSDTDEKGNPQQNPDGSEKLTSESVTTDPDTGEVLNNDSALGKNKTLGQIEEALNSKVKKVAQTATTIMCAAFAVGGAIHAIVAAQQASEILNLVTGFLEAVQKIQAGDGDGSPMAYYTNALTIPGKNGKSGLASQGIGTLFGSKAVNPNDESVKNTNSESLLSDIQFMGKNLANGIDEFEKCAYARAGMGGVDFIIDLVGLATGGLLSLVKNIAKSAAWNLTISVAIQGIIGIIVPSAAKMLITNYIKDFAGEDLGNAIMSGANKYLGKNHQGGGGSPGDIKTVLAFRRETEAILAEEARYDRQTKSPFDISSQNTFLGSLFYKIIPIASNISSATAVTSVISGIGSLISSSFTALLPSASAIADTRLVTTQGDCPMSESIGIMGDVYCNPYYTTDTTTIDYDPGDNFNTVSNLHMQIDKHITSSPINPTAPVSLCEHRHYDAFGNYSYSDWRYSMPTNFKLIKPYQDEDPGDGNCILDVQVDSKENPIINKNSALGEYIVFCGQRDSAWGVADGGIASAMNKFDISTGEAFVDAGLESIVGVIPFVGGAKDVLEASNDVGNSLWIGGGACVSVDAGNNDVSEKQKTKWLNENRFYQRYTEDQRWLEASGLVEKSTVTAMLEEYYKENPLDNSYEGYMARMTGMSKEDVIATLDLMDKITFLAQYDPTNLYPIPAKPEKQISLTEKTQTIIIANHAASPIPYIIIYADTRNRSFAV